nr:2602_t:CDS:1 [Entrophospora candida]
MQNEDNDAIAKESRIVGCLPPHPFTPQKSKHKKGVITTHVISDPESSPIRPI